MPASAPRACPCRRSCGDPAPAGAARRGRPAQRRPCGRAPRARPAPRRGRLPGRAPRGRTRARRRDSAVALPSAAIMPLVGAPDLAATTLALVDIASESRHEAEAVAFVRAALPGPALYDDGEVLLYGEPDAPVVLAGHLDTIPAQGNIPGRSDAGAVHGLGASDMKGGVAVMLELARAGVRGRYLFFTREEVALAESPLPAIFASGLLEGTQLAVVLEPTDNELHAGCLGNLQARITFSGVSAHSARPWTGVNAIHELVRGLHALSTLEPVDIVFDGLVYREVVSAVRVEGGIAANVVPASAWVELNYRFMREHAAERLRTFVSGGEIEILGEAPF